MARGFRGGKRRAAAVERLVGRDGDWCWYCGLKFGTGDRACTIDHVVPVARGGRNHLTNLRLACAYCNGRRSRFPDGEYESSASLFRRRKVAHREAMLAAGAWLPKRAFHHPEIRWLAEGRWECDACGYGRNDTRRSPPTVPCAPWSDAPDSSWVTWWREVRPEQDQPGEVRAAVEATTSQERDTVRP